MSKDTENKGVHFAFPLDSGAPQRTDICGFCVTLVFNFSLLGIQLRQAFDFLSITSYQSDSNQMFLLSGPPSWYRVTL